MKTMEKLAQVIDIQTIVLAAFSNHIYRLLSPIWIKDSVIFY